MENKTILVQHACGRAARLLQAIEPIHAAHCVKHGIDYRPSYAAAKQPLWQKHIETLAACDGSPDGTIVVILDGADTLLVGDEALGSAMELFADLAGVLNARGEMNSGALWWRNSPRVRSFLSRAIAAGDFWWGLSREDQGRLNAMLPELAVQPLNRRWNHYALAGGALNGPVQVRAWHNDTLEGKAYEIGRLIHARQ